MNKAAVIQMVSSSKVQENLEIVEKFIARAKAEDAALVVLPENFAFMGKQEIDKFAIAEAYGQGVIQDKISALAKHYSIWIIAGTILLQGKEKKVRSASLVYDAAGKCAARYDKIHLFDVQVSETESHQESATIERGNEVVVIETPIGKVGLSVCYDLRFPELYQKLREKGAEIIAIPSAFTAITGAAHWEVLLRARAVENLVYILASNQGGAHENGRQTHGHTMIVEPWGKIVQEFSKGNGIVSAMIDLKRLKELRRQFPCNQHHILN